MLHSCAGMLHRCAEMLHRRPAPPHDPHGASPGGCSSALRRPSGNLQETWKFQDLLNRITERWAHSRGTPRKDLGMLTAGWGSAGHARARGASPGNHAKLAKKNTFSGSSFGSPICRIKRNSGRFQRGRRVNHGGPGVSGRDASAASSAAAPAADDPSAGGRRSRRSASSQHAATSSGVLPPASHRRTYFASAPAAPSPAAHPAATLAAIHCVESAARALR